MIIESNGKVLGEIIVRPLDREWYWYVALENEILFDSPIMFKTKGEAKDHSLRVLHEMLNAPCLIVE